MATSPENISSQTEGVPHDPTVTTLENTSRECSAVAEGVTRVLDNTLTPEGATLITRNAKHSYNITQMIYEQFQIRKGDHTTILKEMIAAINEKLPTPVAGAEQTGVINNLKSMGREITHSLDSSMLSFLQVALSLAELKDAAWHLASTFHELAQTFGLMSPADKDKYLKQTTLEHMREHLGKACTHFIKIGTSLNGSLRDLLRSVQKSSLATWHAMEALRYALDAITSIPHDALQIARIPYDLLLTGIKKTQEAVQRFEHKMRATSNQIKNLKAFNLFQSRPLINQSSITETAQPTLPTPESTPRSAPRM